MQREGCGYYKITTPLVIKDTGDLLFLLLSQGDDYMSLMVLETNREKSHILFQTGTTSFSKLRWIYMAL